MSANLKHLGKVQKHIIKLMFEDDYYIHYSFDTRDLSISIILEDTWGNIDRDISDSMLNNLLDRNILIKEDDLKCLEVVQAKYVLNESIVEELLTFLK
jgi:hypothetical protein